MLGYWNETLRSMAFCLSEKFSIWFYDFSLWQAWLDGKDPCVIQFRWTIYFLFSFPSQSGVLRICQLGWLNTQLDYQNQGIFHHFFIVFPFLKIITGYQTTIPRRFLFMHPSHETFYPFRVMMVPCYYMILFLFPCVLCFFSRCWLYQFYQFYPYTLFAAMSEFWRVECPLDLVSGATSQNPCAFGW